MYIIYLYTQRGGVAKLSRVFSRPNTHTRQQTNARMHTPTHAWQPVLTHAYTWQPAVQEPLDLEEFLVLPDQRLLEALSQQDGLSNSDQVGLDLEEPLVLPDQPPRGVIASMLDQLG